ncbi:MAG: Gram-negative bacterial tonB protein [Verrucomicrobia bacterium]|nr:Gram-negative bacterial tonB protein [Verrucomicrobiota bacterium]
MNTKSKLVLSLGLLVAPLALTAKTPESAYLESTARRTDIPVPISVVSPEVDSRYAGQNVMVEFVVDRTGTPTRIAPGAPGVSEDLWAAVTSAVAQWKFSPALVNGRPIARKVALPVVIVGSADEAMDYSTK